MPSFNDYIANFIPPVPESEELQYRAIGLIKGTWLPSQDEPQKGSLLTTEGTILDAVMLGKVMKVSKHHDLTQEQLFVFYPRRTSEKCQVQILGIWNKKTDADPADANGYVNIRGEIAYQSKPTDSEDKVVVKMRRLPKKEGDRPTFFKLTLVGKLSHYAVGGFWDITCKLVGKDIVIQWAKEIAKPRKDVKVKSSKSKKKVVKTPVSKTSIIKKKVVV